MTPSPSTSPSPSPANLLAFYRLVGKLKTTKRTGWVRAGVTLPESIADHMYRMSLIALTAAPAHINATHAAKLALVHDLAEAIVGDITPQDGVSKSDKDAMERAAMRQIACEVVGGGDDGVAAELERLWEEYEAGETAEARFVKQIDKLEMVIQADDYEREQPGMDLSDFFQSTQGVVTEPSLKAVDDTLRTARADRLGRAHSHGDACAAAPSDGTASEDEVAADDDRARS